MAQLDDNQMSVQIGRTDDAIMCANVRVCKQQECIRFAHKKTKCDYCCILHNTTLENTLFMYGSIKTQDNKLLRINIICVRHTVSRSRRTESEYYTVVAPVFQYIQLIRAG